jgi:hypothetical protein
MGGILFDCLTQSLLPRLSRRDLGRALSGSGLVALFGAASLSLWQRVEPPRLVAARNCKKIKDKKKRKQCLRKAKALTSPTPTCNDGITNGSESDIDCGGSCFRCGNSKTCIGSADCLSALCINNVCTTCGDDFVCGGDAHGPCQCRNGIIGSVCTSAAPLFAGSLIPCPACPPGTTACIIELAPLETLCFGPCGGV